MNPQNCGKHLSIECGCVSECACSGCCTCVVSCFVEWGGVLGARETSVSGWGVSELARIIIVMPCNSQWTLTLDLFRCVCPLISYNAVFDCCYFRPLLTAAAFFFNDTCECVRIGGCLFVCLFVFHTLASHCHGPKSVSSDNGHQSNAGTHGITEGGTFSRTYDQEARRRRFLSDLSGQI